MAATQFVIHGIAVPCPPEIEEAGPVAMQRWYDEQAAKAAPKAAKAADPAPKEG
jgi:hypothetical protein